MSFLRIIGRKCIGSITRICQQQAIVHALSSRIRVSSIINMTECLLSVTLTALVASLRLVCFKNGLLPASPRRADAMF